MTSGRGADSGLDTNVPCHRRTGRSPCRGIVDATLSLDGAAVLWHCPVCGDSGETRGWEGTFWDRRPAHF
ncbi:MAG: hypothetical protein M1337_07185 [Actinobacteria bacterium]|nr:hypothetical protein [Actinomycetota bacterium]